MSGSRFDASFLHKAKKANGKRKLKTGSDLNHQLSNWPRDEDRSRCFSSEATEPDLRLNAKIVDQKKGARMKRKANEAVKSPSTLHARYQLHIDHEDENKAES